MKELLTSAYRVPLLVIFGGLVFALIIGVAGSLHATKTLATIDLADGVSPNVEVYLNFEPERFHLEQFQEVGRYLGWREGYAVIMKADPEALRALARKYWITKITEHVETPT